MSSISKKILCVIFLFFLSCISLLANDNFLSLKKNKVNVRYGPTFDSEIKYIYKKKNLPVRIIDKKENFRRIVDLKNNSGWIHVSQLKKINSIIILEDKLLFKKPSKFSKPTLRLEKGRLLIIKKCQKKWCNVETEKFSGWIENENVWGVIK